MKSLFRCGLVVVTILSSVMLNAAEKKSGYSFAENQYVKISISDGQTVKDSYFAAVPGEYAKNISKAFDAVEAALNKKNAMPQEAEWDVFRAKAKGKRTFEVFEHIGTATPLGRNKVGIILLPEKSNLATNGALALYHVPQQKLHSLVFLKKAKGKDSAIGLAPDSVQLEATIKKNIAFVAVSDLTKSLLPVGGRWRYVSLQLHGSLPWLLHREV